MRIKGEYTTPTLDIVEIAVEQGFSASFGDAGYAGDEFDTNDNGSF
jgi:hypothetical protein